MPAGATYEPLATSTLGSAGTITFSSISGSYTDLRIVLVGTASGNTFALRFNGDSGTNYSYTQMNGNGSAVASSRVSHNSLIYGWTSGTTNPAMCSFDIFSYAGATNKTVLVVGSRDNVASGSVARVVNLWRNTAAITSIVVSANGGNMDSGTTATLYGIKAA